MTQNKKFHISAIANELGGHDESYFETKAVFTEEQAEAISDMINFAMDNAHKNYTSCNYGEQQ